MPTVQASTPTTWINNLTLEEQMYLESHSPVKVQVAEDWPPFNYTDNFTPKGYVNDFLYLLEEKTSLEFQFVRGYSWPQYMEMLRDNQIDILSNMTITEDRLRTFRFSDNSIVDIFDGILTTKSNSINTDLETFHGKTIATVKGYSQVELLRRYYPDIKLLLTNNLLDSIKQVIAGNAHAAIGSDAVFNYLINKHLLQGVKSIPITQNTIFPSAPHHFAVNKNNQILLSILNKAISEVSPNDLKLLSKSLYSTSAPLPYQFTAAEGNYLNPKAQISMCVDPDWMPIERIDDGVHVGMMADYIKLISQSIDTPINLISTTTWKESLNYAKERKCDIISVAMSTPERRSYMFFTDPIFTVPLVIATLNKVKFLPDLFATSGKKVGVKAGYAFGSILEKKYPDTEFVNIPSIEVGLKKVKKNELFGVLGALPTVAHTIQTTYTNDIKIGGKTDEQLELRMAVRNDETDLLTIMNKAIGNIKEEEKQQILNRWISVKYEDGVDYSLLIRFFVVTSIIIIFLLSRQYSLRKFSKKLQAQNKEILQQSELLKDTQKQLLLTQYSVDSSSYPIFWLKNNQNSDSAKIIHTNKAAAEILRYTIEEMYALSINDFDMKVSELCYIESSQGQLDSTSKSFNSVYKSKDGSTLPVKIYISSFQYNQSTYHFVFFNDISSQEEMAEQLHRSMKMEAVGLMAGGVAHDLNNILSGVLSYPDLILMNLPLDSELRPHLESIKRSGKQAALVVDDLLTVARGIVASKEPRNPNDLVTEYLSSPEYEMLQSQHPTITCHTNLNPDLFNVTCSATHIMKVIMNLILNAFEAITGSGDVVISTKNVTVVSTKDSFQKIFPGDYAVLIIEDSGPGIPEDVLPHIFEPFYTKKIMGKSGTGLGLTVVWNTIQDHNGKIDIQSGSTGTSMIVYLPKTDNRPVHLTEAQVTPNLRGNGEKILVIDDSPEQLEMVQHILESLNYTPTLVNSGEKALSMLERSSFDLLLLDMIMHPGMGGKETYEKIVQLHPDLKTIIVSGFSENHDTRDTLNAGAKLFIRKPYSMHQIAKAINDTLTTL